MSPAIAVMVGTKRGLFRLESNSERASWTLRGPLANSGWSFPAVSFDHAGGTMLAAGHNAWYGAAVWKSLDQGETWTLSSEGLTLGAAGPDVKEIWSVTPAHGVLYAGTEPPGLFRSEDGGANWRLLGAPLLEQPFAAGWRPGRAGLPVHSIIPHPSDPQQVWIAIAGGGVLHSADGGATWAPRNATAPDGRPLLRVQKLAMAGTAPGLLYQQNHQGVYRSADGGLTWSDITAGLPTAFGFPLVVHPADAQTLYVIPHSNQDGIRHVHDGTLAVWRSRDGGATWAPLTAGLPAGPAYVEVLRDAMATDGLPQAGIYFGTTSGHLFFSQDDGETWAPLASHLPEILSVTAAVIQR